MNGKKTFLLQISGKSDSSLQFSVNNSKTSDYFWYKYTYSESVLNSHSLNSLNLK